LSLADADNNSAADVDRLANGFKIRDSGSPRNANGDQYIYFAFAEHPFKYARAV